MKFKSIYVFAFLFIISIFGSFAQSSNKQPLKLVKYNDNVKESLTLKEKTFIQEVYGDKFDAYVMSRPQKLKDLKNLLRNRVVIKEMPDFVNYSEKYKTLSSAGLFNLYNPTLEFDKAYDKDNFNVLKYNLEFFGRGSRIYRIDNTNYFIIVKSQHQ
ncbi:hypothetical protein [Lacinutrix sp.]|uniref:hypothetical protein n=1 Tax=Lacinutrix sp. TaxID=1937692 RepID=UPI0025C353C3|nr:hypothetical protein [Lacinutrix sp.]